MHIADLFYMIIHDESGASRLHQAATEYGLAAALLTELVHTGRIEIDPQNERLKIVRRDPPMDSLTHQVLDILIAEPKEHPLRTWIRYLGLNAVPSVAERIARTGLLETKNVRKGLVGKKTTVYVPVNPQDFEAKYAILRIALLQAKITDWEWGWCAGLAYATGLSQQLLIDAPPQSFTYLDWIVARQLPVSGQPLISATAAVISERVFAHHSR